MTSRAFPILLIPNPAAAPAPARPNAVPATLVFAPRSSGRWASMALDKWANEPFRYSSISALVLIDSGPTSSPASAGGSFLKAAAVRISWSRTGVQLFDQTCARP